MKIEHNYLLFLLRDINITKKEQSKLKHINKMINF